MYAEGTIYEGTIYNDIELVVLVMRVASAIGHGGTNDGRRCKAVDLVFGDEFGLEEFFANGDAFSGGIDAQLAGAVVADPFDHSGDERGGGGNASAAFIGVSGDAIDAFICHHEAGFLKFFEAVEQAVSDERQEGVKFEVTLANCVGNGSVVTDDEHAGLDHGFGDDGINFSGHDRASGLSGWQINFADARLRSRRHEPEVCGDFEQ